METRHGGIDALRGVLALVVLLAHSAAIYLQPILANVDDAVRWARAAVLFFFVLSGHVIAASLETNRRRGFSASAYVISRVARIVPPLLAVIGIALAISVALHFFGRSTVPFHAERTEFGPDVAQQLLALFTLGLAGDLTGELNGPLWTLAYEIQLYVVAGLLATIAYGKNQVLASVLLAAFVSYAPLSPLSNKDFDMRVVYIAAFGLGALTHAVKDCPRSIGVMIASAVALMVGAALWQPTATESILLRECLHKIGICAMCGLLILAIVRTDAFATWGAIGATSYTVYALHFPLLLAPMFFMQRRHDSAAGALAMFAAVSIGTYAACHFVGLLVERPQEHRKRLLALLRLQGQ
jgi:peptidoglycan/LPS O-acetylase OafA/YrhL